jgi:hypothetical protein
MDALEKMTQVFVLSRVCFDVYQPVIQKVAINITTLSTFIIKMLNLCNLRVFPQLSIAIFFQCACQPHLTINMDVNCNAIVLWTTNYVHSMFYHNHICSTTKYHL